MPPSTEVPNSELRSIDGGGLQQQPAAYQQQQQQPYRSNAAATAQPRELRLELGVVELSLTAEAMRSSGQRPRSVRVRIEPPPGVDEGTSSGVLETNALATGSSAAPQLRFDSSHEILLERGGRAWSALQRALEGPKPPSDLYFVAVDSNSGATIGEASLRCVAEDNEAPMQTRAVAPGGSGMSPVRFDWTHLLPLNSPSAAPAAPMPTLCGCRLACLSCSSR